ncbi:beta-lactamase [Pseudomonas putida]|uniref:Beta-lactamase n=1 Tax=Pseudomonas putida TaxID=303 RepID=A0AA37VSM8_PSEPU|nr:class C beta-lactamase [Pseudomonas putida]GLO12350.1 beta-lactamase [Pseudomonas putida]GLO35267.1 beta-lactamase [Pseudomonas putida]HDS0966546.1 beta-lactamase [Pseudomonas putida]HDS0967527.1 beta-lactamase [Pseudomonas putida]HDS0990291.1 beta-lactamase [Pseudomonas putida]
MPLSRLTALAASITLTLGHASAQADDQLQAKVDRIIRPLMQAQGISGMAVAIYARDHAHYFSYGVASKAENVPVSRDTLFEIGSLSKTYTATLAALASAEGQLDFEAPAKRYHPALGGSPIGNATVLELGAYSADCLPLQFPDDVQTPQQVVDFFRHWQPRAKPGTQRCYSNPSLGLFGDLAARAQHQPFATLMTDGLLPKMGLENTYLHVPASAQGLYAQGYDATDKPVRVGPGPYADEAYGIKTSASDLLRYVRLHMQPQGLPPALASATAITQQGYFQVGAMTQGLGWERYPYPVTLATLVDGNSPRLIREPQATTRLQPTLPAQPAAWYNKTGSTNGFGAYAAFVPSEQLAVVLLANRNYPNEARVRAAFEILSGL